MINKQFKTLGLTYSFGVPQTAAEYDQLAKREGACVESAVANQMYRGVFAKVRALFTEALEEQSKIERRTKETGKNRTIKGENGAPDTVEAIVVWDETEQDYLNRVLAATSSKLEDYQGLLDSITSKLTFDPSEAEAAPSAPRKTAKKWLDAAQEIINAGAADKVAAALTAKLGMPVEASLESLGRAIAEDQRRKSVVAEYV